MNWIVSAVYCSSFSVQTQELGRIYDCAAPSSAKINWCWCQVVFLTVIFIYEAHAKSFYFLNREVKQTSYFHCLQHQSSFSRSHAIPLLLQTLQSSAARACSGPCPSSPPLSGIRFARICVSQQSQVPGKNCGVVSFSSCPWMWSNSAVSSLELDPQSCLSVSILVITAC